MELAFLSWSIQAAVTEYHRLGSLNNKHLFLAVMEAGKSKIMMLAESVLGEAPHPALCMATFSLYLYMEERKRDRES